MTPQEVLSTILNYSNLKMNALAKKVGTGPQTFYDIRDGRHGFSPRIADLICKAYPNLSKAWIITGEGRAVLENEAFNEGEEEEKNKIPLYNDVETIGGYNGSVANVETQHRVSEWIDAGDWFPDATAAIHHYGDSMVEYPSGSILVLKRVNDPRLLINGEHYVIETDEFRITKQIQDDGDVITAYSTNRETYPDGRLIHSPIRIPKEAIRHLDLVVGCVIKKFGNPARIK